MRSFLILFLLLQLILILINSQSTQIVNFALEKFQQRVLETQMMNNKVKYQLLEINRFHQIQVVAENYHILFTKIDKAQNINLNLYSVNAPFGYMFQIRNLQVLQNQVYKNKKNQSQTQRNYFTKTAQNFINQIKSNLQFTQKICSHLQYKHFLSLQTSTLELSSQKNYQKFLIIAIYFPQSHRKIFNSDFSNQKINLVSLITCRQTIFQQKSLQKHFQYKLNKGQSQIIKMPTSVIINQRAQKQNNLKSNFFTEYNQSFLIFQILHIVGNFQYSVSLIKYQKYSNSILQSIQIATNLNESTYNINRSLIKDRYEFSNQWKKNINNETSQIYIAFEIKCIQKTQKTCIFLSSVENPSKIKQLVPGLPYIYSINEIQIFQIKNPFDLQIFIDINKKNGLPQYQICSTKKTFIEQNQCIKQLRNPISTIHVLQVKQKDDKIHTFGRNHQFLINAQHEEYCYKCSYYIALYAQYDNILGTITFKNELSATIVPEGNSVTKILKRNQSDTYLIYGQESRILFQNFSGQYQIYYQQKNLQIQHDFSIDKSPQDRKLLVDPQTATQNEKYYSIDIREAINNLSKSKQKQSGSFSPKKSNKVYMLSIQTKNNYPSIFYSMIIVNNQSRKIVLKDGVPFYNRQMNKVSVFKYLSENLQTQSFGTIIINSNQIQQVALQIYGDCLALQSFQKNQKQFKTQKQRTSTLQTLKNRAKMSSLTGKKTYLMQKIQNTKVNLMANRIDIIIEPRMCKSYIIKIINNSTKQTFISYQILVSFIDSIILTLNNQLPGILQYPGKIIQIYQIYVPEKTNLSIMINFCRSAKSRMKIYRNKEALIAQNVDEKVFFNSQSQFQESIYLARAGVFYVTIQFFGFSNILEYTILVKQHETQEGFYYVDLSKQEREISYQVKDGRFFSTTYELYFSPLFLKHWSKDIQRDVEYFETNYFILESNSYPLLKRASNCKGQFFSDIVNHHEHFRQVKLQKQKLKFYPLQKDNLKEKSQLSYYQRGYYSYEYETNNPLSFLIIVPVIARSTLSGQIAIIRYWQFDKKSRQPYQIIQLYNGKLYSVFEHWLVSFIIWAEQIVDFHVYESFLVMMIVFCLCLPLSCCLLICVYKTKVQIEFYCNKLFNRIQTIANRSSSGQNSNQQIQISQRQPVDQNEETQIISLPVLQNLERSQSQSYISNQSNDQQQVVDQYNEQIRIPQEDQFHQEMEQSPLT